MGEIENVVIRAGDCSLTLSPSLGGKLASLKIGPHELLQTPLNPYAPRTREMGFDEGDASGWDECLPSVAECDVDTAAGPAHIPDHGDLWRVPWQVIEATADSATFVGDCFSLPLVLTRSVFLSKTPTGWRLSLMYTVANRGSSPAPWSWCAHPLFVAESGDRVVLPPSIQSLRLEGSGDAVLGQSGDIVQWPVATLADSSSDDLSIAKGEDSGRGDKLFTGRLSRRAGEDWCALERPGIGFKLTVRFDPEATPYLGLWLCYGGWPEGHHLRQQCVALEPATAPVDSLAISGPWSRTLEPGATFSWPMELELERLHEKVEGMLA